MCVSCTARVSATLQVFTPEILDGATCRLGDLGDVRDVLGVLVVW